MLGRIKGGAQRVEPFVTGSQRDASAVEANDPRWPLESAEQDHDAPVLPEMRDRFGTAANEVEVGDLPRVEDPEPAKVSLGRDVDMAGPRERCGADEEEALGLDPGGELVADLGEYLGYGANLPPRKADALA